MKFVAERGVVRGTYARMAQLGVDAVDEKWCTMIVPVLENVSGVETGTGSDVLCRMAATHHDRIAAFELVYRKYVDAELISPNRFNLRVTPYHLLPTTNVFVACEGSRIICTVTLIGDAELGLPMESIYQSELLELRRRNLYVGEVSCLAFEPMALNKFLLVFMQLTRLMAQHARAYGMDQFVIAVHPQHARFYQRFMGFEQIGQLKTYPSVRNAPAVACSLDFAAIDVSRPKCWTSYFGSRLPESVIRSRPMTDEECDYFRPMAGLAGRHAPELAFA